MMVYIPAPSRLKPVPLDVRDFTVGAGLLANALCQALQRRKVNRVRQQAGSYGSIRARRVALENQWRTHPPLPG